MKNLNTILIGILIVAVGVLYFIQFSSAPAASQESATSDSGPVPEGVVFVNTDSLFENYDKYQALSKQYETKAQSLQTEYQNRAEGLQREVANYQQTRNNLTIGQARAVEEDLVKKEQNLMQYQQSLQQQLMQEESTMINDLYDGIQKYLDKYGKENNIQVVLTYSNSNRNVLFANDALDITKTIVEGLNQSYNNGSMVSADTTAVQ